MKKTVSLLLSAIILLSLASCGAKKDSTEAGNVDINEDTTEIIDENVTVTELTEENIFDYLDINISFQHLNDSVCLVMSSEPAKDNYIFEDVNIEVDLNLNWTVNYLFGSAQNSAQPKIPLKTNSDGTLTEDCMLILLDAATSSATVNFGDCYMENIYATGTVKERTLTQKEKKEREEKSKKAMVITKDSKVELLSPSELCKIFEGNEAYFEKNYTGAYISFKGTVQSVKTNYGVRVDSSSTISANHKVINFEEGWFLAISKYNNKFDLSEYAPGDVLKVTTAITYPEPSAGNVWTTGNDYWSYGDTDDTVNTIPTSIEIIKSN